MGKQDDQPGYPPAGHQPPEPTGPWTDRIAFAPDRPWAFHPKRLIIGLDEGGAMPPAADELRKKHGGQVAKDDDGPLLEDRFGAVRIDFPDIVDVLGMVARLGESGVVAEPDIAVFAHAGCCGGCSCCGGAAASPVFASPVFASPVFASPVFASPVFASPVFASPVFASPVFASPVFASRYRSSGDRTSTALPGAAPARRAPQPVTADAGSVKVVVLDTGIAHAKDLPGLVARHATTDPSRWEFADEDINGLLDPAAGHGTFIAGIIEQIVSGVTVEVHRVLSTMGDGFISDIAVKIDALTAAGAFDKRTILNLSFGTYADAHLLLLSAAIELVQAQGAVVVASAGNDGLCAPQAPAGLPEVIGVASIEATGGAPYSNHGPWIRACAPGTDVVSSFFQHFDGVAAGNPDPDLYENWATWSGTSFAAPIVAGMLAAHLARDGGATADDAVASVIDAPGLLRVPNFGTVINHSLS